MTNPTLESLGYYEPAIKIVGVTKSYVPDAPDTDSLEDYIAWCARVSNPASQASGLNNQRLLSYLVRNAHWSPFEMASISIEIKAPRDITRQILRHRSFSFQEYSGRYAVMSNFVLREAREQDLKNRQASHVTDSPGIRDGWEKLQLETLDLAVKNYEHALSLGIAKEQARCLLPEGLALSTVIMSGTVRSWLHYCALRSGNGTQLEHANIARKIKSEVLDIFLPSVSAVLENHEKTEL